MDLYKTLSATIAATYMALAGCGAASQATTTTTANQAAQEPEDQQQECPPQLLQLMVAQGNVTAIFDSDGNGQPDYMEVRLVAEDGVAAKPFIYGWDRNGDGWIDEDHEGEMLYDPAMDGLNGNEMTPAQFRDFQRGQQAHPTPPLESRLYRR